MYASSDPVALDVACADAVNAQSPIEDSLLVKSGRSGDYFKAIFPHTNWRWTTRHAAELVIGSEEYELIEI